MTYAECKSQGFDFIVGVPCSSLKQFIEDLQRDEPGRYIPVQREDTAVALAVGAFFAGKKPLVFLQNSGLGHIVNIVSSLLIPYEIPIHFLVTMREMPFEHTHMYKITKPLLSLLGIESRTFLFDASSHV
ncbi:MAG: thiamine pyrophosphate-binding protein [Candidatus Peribacteraceae bacterium]|nr:thiamine pyrophosphate-binding protein [Candidatus Peribacteraceae bacterium]